MTQLRNLAGILSTATAGIAALGIAVLLGINLWEMLLRYLVNRPTMWAFDLSSYLLCLCSMAALPKVVESGLSISVTLIVERLNEAHAALARTAIELIAGSTCLLVSAVAAFIAVQQYKDGNVTVAAFAIPKWWLTSVVCYGFGLSGAMHFFRRHSAGSSTGSAI